MPQDAGSSTASGGPRLGVLAGGGSLPRQIVDVCRRRGRDVFVVAFDDATDHETVVDVEHLWTRLGAVGRTIAWLKERGVEELVLAGRITRPSWSAARPDLRGLRLLPKMLAGGQGDDSVLSLAIRELETDGFRVVGVHEILPDLLAPGGAFGRVKPDAAAFKDILRGIEAARALGAADIGQSVVVQQGIVLGVEAVEGTDALIERCGALRRQGRGGVLVKCAKPEQERRADLPSIGSATVRHAATAGLRGVAVAAGQTLVLDRSETVRSADAAGLFVYGFETET